MKKVLLKLSLCTCLFMCVSCGSLEQWATGLQTLGNSLTGAGSYSTGSSYNTGSSYSGSSTTTLNSKEWHNCSSCSGTGKCKHCSGTGKYSYSKNGKCGVCRGTGRCAGCEGKGGWYI